MAETRPTAAKASTSSVQPKRSSNSISWMAPLFCIIIGYVIWRFVIGSPDNFTIGKQNGKRDGLLESSMTLALTRH